MGKLKKFCAMIASACLMGTLFTGCGGGDTAQKTDTNAKVLTGGGSNTMYIIMPPPTNPFFKLEAEVAEAKAKELGYDTKILIHNDDVATQSDLFDEAINEKAAAIICDNASSNATVIPIKKAREANIPTFLIDREITEKDLAISQIVADNYQGAKGIAEVFVEAMGEQGTYVELLGRETDTNAHIRSAAYHEVIDAYPNMKMVAQQTAHWEQTEATEVMERILQDHPDIKGLVCGNDTMAIGALTAIKNAGLLGKVIVIGLDGSDDAAEAIKAGNMLGTALQQAKVISESAVVQADKYLKEGSTGKDEKQLVDCIIITKENVAKLKSFVYTP